MTFSEKIRMLIEERDLTQKSVAQALHIPVSTLGGYVQGTSEPDFETLKILASFFHVTADYLLGLRPENVHVEKEAELLRVFRALTEEQQDLYLEQGKAFFKINAREAAKSSYSSQRNSQAG